MNRRRIIMIAAIILVLLMALIVGFVWWRRQPAVTTQLNNTNTIVNATNTTTTTTTSSTNDDSATTPIATTVNRSERQAISSTASSFTERFGSYSSDTHFENIERSRYLMTDTMSKQADELIKQGNNQDQFSSVDSTVASVNITDYADGSTGATVEVPTRQTIRAGQNNISYKNQTARLTLKKAGDRWLVDSFRWL